MYVCVHMYRHVCVYACIYIYMIYIYIYIYIHYRYTHVCIYIYIYYSSGLSPLADRRQALQPKGSRREGEPKGSRKGAEARLQAEEGEPHV